MRAKVGVLAHPGKQFFALQDLKELEETSGGLAAAVEEAQSRLIGSRFLPDRILQERALGDPFGGDVITDNLRLTGTTVPTSPPGVVPEARTSSLVLLGLAGLFVWRWHKVRSLRSGPEHQLP